MDLEKLKQESVKFFKRFGYDIVAVEEFAVEEKENGVLETYLVTTCHHEEDIENGYPAEEETKPFWFDLIPRNGKYAVANVTMG